MLQPRVLEAEFSQINYYISQAGQLLGINTHITGCVRGRFVRSVSRMFQQWMQKEAPFTNYLPIKADLRCVFSLWMY